MRDLSRKYWEAYWEGKIILPFHKIMERRCSQKACSQKDAFVHLMNHMVLTAFPSDIKTISPVFCSMSFPRFCFITHSGFLFILPFLICFLWRNWNFENETGMGKKNDITLIRVEDALHEPSQLFVKKGKAVMWFVDPWLKWMSSV